MARLAHEEPAGAAPAQAPGMDLVADLPSSSQSRSRRMQQRERRKKRQWNESDMSFRAHPRRHRHLALGEPCGPQGRAASGPLHSELLRGVPQRGPLGWGGAISGYEEDEDGEEVPEELESELVG